jgi:hypothetical protein
MVDEKRHEQSVTAEPCGCGYLERMAAEANGPITYDSELNEYLLRWPDGTLSQGPIYHCPFCGGAAPESRRASLFATVTTAELMRLRDLTAGLETLEQATAKFGSPQADIPDGITIQTPGSAQEPSQAASYRKVTWTGLSQVADVELVHYGVRGVKFIFTGTYVGKP